MCAYRNANATRADRSRDFFLGEKSLAPKLSENLSSLAHRISLKPLLRPHTRGKNEK